MEGSIALLLLSSIMFKYLNECISYYQEYHLTKHKYHYRAKSLVFFDQYNLKDIRRYHIKEYAKLRCLRVSNATVNREVSFACSAVNRVMYDYELKLNNPFSAIKLTENDYIPNYLSRIEYERLLKSALETNNITLHDFIVLLTMTGCRPSELLTLTWDNVSLDKYFFIVRNEYSKNKRTMYKYLNDTAFDVLKNKDRLGDYVFTSPRTGGRYTTMTKSFARCKKRAGVKCRMYDLRHTYASWLVQSGVGIYTIKDLMGHGDIDSTMRYAHLDYAQFKSAVDLII